MVEAIDPQELKMLVEETNNHFDDNVCEDLL